MRLPSALLALVLSVGVAAPMADAQTTATTTPRAAATFGDALNSVRASAGLRSVRPDRRLAAAAQAHAEDMARNGYHSHVSRNGSNFVARARAAGCRGGYMAENIAWGQRTAQATFDGWMASPGHNRNMMGRPYGVYGLGQAGGMWVIMFADRC